MAHSAYQIFDQAHPAISSILEPLSGWVMPEHFWELGFRPKDLARMTEQIAAARHKSAELQVKFSQYPTAEKLAVERAYVEILDVLSTTAGRQTS